MTGSRAAISTAIGTPPLDMYEPLSNRGTQGDSSPRQGSGVDPTVRILSLRCRSWREAKFLSERRWELNETREAGIDDSVYECRRSGGRGYGDRYDRCVVVIDRAAYRRHSEGDETEMRPDHRHASDGRGPIRLRLRPADMRPRAIRRGIPSPFECRSGRTCPDGVARSRPCAVRISCGRPWPHLED
jgi:hypothetical protein